MEYTYEFLRNCHGLRFRATLMNKPQEGVIKVKSEGVMLCYGEEDPGYLVTFGRRDTLSFSKQTFAVLPSDFEIVPRDPETYMDWQVGDDVCKNNIEYRVIFRCGETVICKEKRDGAAVGPYTCEEIFDMGGRFVLTDIEKQILEEHQKTKWKPQDGDVCYSPLPMPTIFIKEGDEENHRYYKAYIPDKDYLSSGSGRIVPEDFQIDIRPATDAQKQLLFAALANNGKRWNAEKKVIEDIEQPECDEPVSDEPTFKKFDAVLVRCGIYDTWKPAVFKRYGDANECPYITVEGYGFQDCVPLNEDTEILICTTNLDSEEK